MANFEKAPSTESTTGTENIGFDVIVSSPKLALRAVRRRIYLLCQRQTQHTLTYRGRRIARDGIPNFDFVRREVSRHIQYTPPIANGLL